MNKTKFFKGSLLTIFALLLFSSCATIVAGGSPKITIDGNIKEPVTITTSKQTYQNVTLPYVVQVNRRNLDGQRIYVRSENIRYRDIVLQKTINGWTFGNILIGGLIGWGVDLSTNCVSKPAQTYFFIDAKDTQEPQEE